MRAPEGAYMGDMGVDRGRRIQSPFDWAQAPPEAPPGERRFYTMSRASPNGLAMFVFGVLVFSWWGVGPMVVANLIGLALWGVTMVAAQRGRVRLNTGLIYACVSTWAVLTVVFVGWDFGGQYALMVQMLATILNPWSRRLAWAMALMLAGVFVALYHYSRGAAPLYAVPAAYLSIAYTLNVLGTFVSATILVALPVGEADRAEVALAAEHVRSESLLTNILPVPIAKRLKDGEEPIADRVNAASVLFADIVDFTPLASQLPPDDVVALLDSVFTCLDGLVDQHGLEKIKTLGDAYMVAAGLPAPREDHAQALARFALAAPRAIAQLPGPGPRLQLRIGIASGPVVAGVIGRRRLLYDLWGDTVNTASRMESHGLPGHIQITQATRHLLGADFHCEERGLIDIKGKGPMRTYLLVAAR